MNNIKEKMFIPLSNDLQFKNLFGTTKNKKFTADLLESFLRLKKGTLKKLEVINSVKLDRETIMSKRFEVDVLVKLPNGNIYNLEMQNLYNQSAENKNILYILNKFANQIHSGEDYDILNLAVQLDFVNGDRVHKSNKIIKRFCWVNDEDNTDFLINNLIMVYLIDVANRENLDYTKVSEDFDKWRKFIGAETLEEAEKIASDSEILKEALEEMQKFSSNDYVQDYKAKDRLIASQMREERRNGIKDGIETTKIETAKNLLEDDISIEKVQRYTGLSIDKIEELKNNLTN